MWFLRVQLGRMIHLFCFCFQLWLRLHFLFQVFGCCPILLFSCCLVLRLLFLLSDHFFLAHLRLLHSLLQHCCRLRFLCHSVFPGPHCCWHRRRCVCLPVLGCHPSWVVSRVLVWCCDCWYGVYLYFVRVFVPFTRSHSHGLISPRFAKWPPSLSSPISSGYSGFPRLCLVLSSLMSCTLVDGPLVCLLSVFQVPGINIWPAHRADLLFCNFFDMLTPVPYHHFFSSLILLSIYV